MTDILMVEPTGFNVEYNINPWMETGLKEGVLHSKAYDQWSVLRYTLISNGLDVEIISDPHSFPDAVFAANAGLLLGNTFVLSRFRFLARMIEEPFWMHWADKKGYSLFKTSYPFEGEGDALFGPDGTLFIGYGQRTHRLAISEIQARFPEYRIVPVKLIRDVFYHLDTCLSFAGNTVIYYPDAIENSEEFLDAIAEYDVYELDSTDAFNFACNGFYHDSTYYVSDRVSKGFKSRLRKNGTLTRVFEFDEFKKSGGSVKCTILTL